MAAAGEAVKPAAKTKPAARLDDLAAPAALAQTVLRLEAQVAQMARAAQHVDLPVSDISLALVQLRRPFAPEAVKWKVQTEWGGGALLVAYIDVRLVIERLNIVWPWWRPVFEPISGGLRCTLTLFDPYDASKFMVRSDVGMGGDAKTLNSDALKRAAVGYGVGVSIYSLSQVKRKVGNADSELRTEKRRKKGRDGKYVEAQVPVIDERTAGWLADRYELWLENKGTRLFGAPLDHGDEEHAQGLDADSPLVAMEDAGGDAVTETEPAGPEPLKDDRAVELRTMCEGYYGQFRKLAPRKMPPAAFQARLLDASVSHEALEALAAELEALVLEHGGDGGS